MYDSITLSFRIGAWFDTSDEGHYELPISVVVPVPTNDLSIVEVRESLRDLGWTPWSDEVRSVSYYANASSSHLEVVVSVLPIVQEALVTGSAQALAEFVLTKLISIVKATTRSKALTLDEATEQAQWHLLRHAGVDLPNLQQISADLREDESWFLVYRDKRRKRDLELLIDRRGVVAFTDLQEIAAYQKRRLMEQP